MRSRPPRRRSRKYPRCTMRAMPYRPADIMLALFHYCSASAITDSGSWRVCWSSRGSTRRRVAVHCGGVHRLSGWVAGFDSAVPRFERKYLEISRHGRTWPRAAYFCGRQRSHAHCRVRPADQASSTVFSGTSTKCKAEIFPASCTGNRVGGPIVSRCRLQRFRLILVTMLENYERHSDVAAVLVALAATSRDALIGPRTKDGGGAGRRKSTRRDR